MVVPSPSVRFTSSTAHCMWGRRKSRGLAPHSADTRFLPSCHRRAAELPLPPGARALFLLKRKARLCVTEPEAVDGAGGVEWNTRCTQVGAPCMSLRCRPRLA